MNMKNTGIDYQAYIYALTEQVEQHIHGLDELAEQSLHGSLSFNQRSATERNLQVLTEAVIGVSKHLLKAKGLPVPSEARAAVERIYEHLALMTPDIKAIRGAIALRNAIVHDYLNLDWDRILPVLQERRYVVLHELVTLLCSELGKNKQ
ncbi:type VII toxin-antitoxin system HepT family RNase toxin [Bowmanella denitrificans]|uniref:type VII toxin-antitoxin system HepT family RNase toxin n=1 Tax=Bowmanella denitrificans TaxID=366582 RepID=UPI000C9A3472|nr:DUF86 domain-containing protein [Bowmanella denitrificans]